MRPKYQAYARDIIRDLVLTMYTVKYIAKKFNVPINAISDITTYYFSLTPTEVRYHHWLTPVPGMVDIQDVETASMRFLKCYSAILEESAETGASIVDLLHLTPKDAYHEYIRRRFGLPAQKLTTKVKGVSVLKYGQHFVIPNVEKPTILDGIIPLQELPNRVIEYPAKYVQIIERHSRIPIHLIDIVITNIRVNALGEFADVNIDLPTHILLHNRHYTVFKLTELMRLELKLYDDGREGYRVSPILYVGHKEYRHDRKTNSWSSDGFPLNLTIQLDVHIKVYGKLTKSTAGNQRVTPLKPIKDTTALKPIVALDGQSIFG